MQAYAAVDHPRKNDISSKLQCAMYLFHVQKNKRILLVSWPQFLWQLCSFFLLPLFVMLCVPTFQRQCNVMFETSYHFTIFIPPNNQNIFIDLCAYIVHTDKTYLLFYCTLRHKEKKNIILFSVSCVPRFYS